MSAVCVMVLLCLVSLSHSFPLTCDNLVQPVDQLDPRNLEGRWALVAGSLKINQAEMPPKISDSTRIDFYNSTYIQASLFGNMCNYHSQDISLEGHSFNFSIGQSFNFSGTFFKTSCPDCVVLSLVVDSPNYKTVELYLFSKRREVDQKQLEEFITLVECLKMPKHFLMDPTKGLCPGQTAAAAQTE